MNQDAFESSFVFDGQQMNEVVNYVQVVYEEAKWWSLVSLIFLLFSPPPLVQLIGFAL